MDFYDRIKTLVKARKWSLVEFLQSIGINYDTYKSSIRYGNLPRLDECSKIARALGVSLEYLATGQDTDGLSDDERSLINDYRDASEESRANAADLLFASAQRSRNSYREKNA